MRRGGSPVGVHLGGLSSRRYLVEGTYNESVKGYLVSQLAPPASTGDTIMVTELHKRLNLVAQDQAPLPGSVIIAWW